MRSPARRGFTLVELLVVIGIISILMGMLFPAIQSVRGAVRNMYCKNNLRQLGIAALHYHNDKGHFPMGRGRKSNGQSSWSQHARLLPYIEQKNLQNMIDFSEAPGSGNAKKMTVTTFLCPSDENRMTEPEPKNHPGWGKNNYKANAGSDVGTWDNKKKKEQNNGIFLTDETIRLRDITDGTSQTALFAEAVLGDGDVFKVEEPGDWFPIPEKNKTTETVFRACDRLVTTNMRGLSKQIARSGRNWVYGNYIPTRYNHVMPPNSRSCVRSGSTRSLDATVNSKGGATTASSRHAAGVNVCLVDGSVHFIHNSIDLEIWRALGSRNGRDDAEGEW